MGVKAKSSDGGKVKFYCEMDDNTDYCPRQTIMTSTEAPLITNSSGWAVYHMRVIGNYFFSIQGRQMETQLRPE